MSQLIAGGIKHILCESTGKRLLEAVTHFLQILSREPLPFADLAAYLFAAINLSQEYDYIVSFVTSPNESLSLEMALIVSPFLFPYYCKRCDLSNIWCIGMGGEWNFA